MKAITLNIPEASTFATFDYSVYLAAKLYEDGIMSAGQAADVANLSKRAFIEIMGKYGVSVFNYSPEELARDIANASCYAV
jgi:predicted HTH domain antitoxin